MLTPRWSTRSVQLGLSERDFQSLTVANRAARSIRYPSLLSLLTETDDVYHLIPLRAQ